MNRICGKRQCLPRLHKVVETNAELRCEIPHTCSTRLTVRHDDVRRVFVVRPDKSARTLQPGSDLLAWLQIPTQNDRRNADTCEGSTVIRKQCRSCLAFEFVLRFLKVRRRCKGLPVGHQFTGVFKLPAQYPRQMLVGDDLSKTESGTGKTEIGTVANSYATLKKRAELPGQCRQRRRCGTVILGSGRLSHDEKWKHTGGQNNKRRNEFFQHSVCLVFF